MKNVGVYRDEENMNLALSIAASLGIPQGGLVAVGDSLNDMEMIRDAAVSVAVDNAREEVKQVADMVTG